MGALNLEYLIPDKYRDSDVMAALLTELDDLVGDWVDSADGIADLLNPETVPNAYMQHLASLLGAVLISSDDATEEERRDELRRAVDWIKLKGTYQSIQVVGLILGMNIDVLGMYTDDYATFSLQDWFVGLVEDQNPAGLDSTYYKSPHFGIQVKLNVKYAKSGSWQYDYLWIPTMASNLSAYIEKTRPVNTVPHYYTFMEPKCDDDGEVESVDGDIYTTIKGSWTTTKLYFDQTEALGSGQGWNFDEDTPEHFDTSQDAFYNGITKWILGTGSKGSSPGDSGWDDIETSVLSGTVDDLRVYSDRIEWKFIISARTLHGISELGLYTPGSPDILRVASTFPDINMGGNMSLRIKVTVNRV